MPKQLAIVVPCYNEEAVIGETVKRLHAVLDGLIQRGRISPASRIYLVDDGSKDRTWQLIHGFSYSDGLVVGVKLSRNCGHQRALLAGLSAAEGDAVVTIDADLQDDVDAIERMFDEYERGADVVLGVRSSRQTDSFFKRTTAQGFYRLLSACGVETVHDHADYRLLSRRAVEALQSFGERNIYLRGVVPLLGFRTAIVEYVRAERFAGETKYPLRKMLALAVDAITSFSVAPLRLISALGLLFSAGSVAMAAWVLAVRLLTDRAVPGWGSTVLPIYFLGGIQMLALGVIGEYLGKIYVESKARPRFFIETVTPQPAAASQPAPLVLKAGNA